MRATSTLSDFWLRPVPTKTKARLAMDQRLFTYCSSSWWAPWSCPTSRQFLILYSNKKQNAGGWRKRCWRLLSCVCWCIICCYCCCCCLFVCLFVWLFVCFALLCFALFCFVLFCWLFVCLVRVLAFDRMLQVCLWGGRFSGWSATRSIPTSCILVYSH